ncbi:MAG: glycosyltransferase family 39 protein [Candidatus Shapirobacteria bacterium]|nr:glycosyltransferase family 39 protein [Candidatus Shapirobacteria bacterium]
MIKKYKFFIKIIVIILIIGVFFLTRLQNLTSIPVFGDEAIYIRWAQVIKSVETLRFIPQTDGKQPLFMWVTAIIFKFISDPLIAGRFVSILAGLGIMLGIFLTTSIIVSFSKKESNPFKFIFLSIKENFYLAIFSSLIYIFLPFSFFFDRLAVPDNMLSLFGIWSLFFSLLLAKFKRLDLTFILGVILGLAWLTKSPAVYFIVLSVFTYLVFNLKNLKTIYLPVISVIISFIIYNILRLGPQFQMIAIRNKDYIWPLSEILKHPFDPLKPHLLDTISIYWQYISVSILFFSILGLILLIIKNKKHLKFDLKYLVLTSWWILPLISNCIFAKVFTARYILFTLPPLIILITLLLSNFFSKNIFKILFLVLLSIPNFIFIKNLSLNPFNVKLLGTETGYLQSWTSGWGIKESADFLKVRSLEANVIVGTEGNFGTLPDGLQIYTNQVNQLTIIGLGLGFTQIPQNLINAKNYGDEVYLLINKSRFKIDSIDQSKLTLIKSFSKPDQDELLLYQL